MADTESTGRERPARGRATRRANPAHTGEAVARAARERSEQERETPPLNATGSHPTERPALSLGSDDWPATLADKIVEIVDAVRVQTTDRVVLLLRAVVYCLVAAVAAIAIVVLITIAAIRVADAYLPIGAGVGSATWAAHGFVGLLVSIIGLGFWRARAGSAKPLYAALILDTAIVVGVAFYGVIVAVT